MSEKDKKEQTAPAEETAQETAEQTAAPAEEAAQEETFTVTKSQMEQMEQLAKVLADANDKYLRLAAEYDNFRKRSQKEKDELYTVIKAETVGKFLPVYDNLERALAQETADEAYKKGVEMTMNQLVKVMEGLGVTSFGEIGEAFDPARHNAVMHVEQEGLGENVIAEVFQKGFLVGEKVIRFAMVKVAN